MADEKVENEFINKVNTGFPDYLDWEKLRDEGREYLGKYSGKLWTDHNTHDPGITILEMLCYAIMDLGYRTNLPEADIFAKDPSDSSGENNFFTPSQILVCNPVTITDFRKMLIDIEGVKNAWLEDSFDNCNDPDYLNEAGCSYCYNGLYHVYLELEDEYVLENENEKKEYEKLIEKIKRTLLSHRNLCEDFIDIHILCRKKIGLCADIELQASVDAEEVYVTLVESIRNFFSPAPKFYTLSQLLDEKNKYIEDVFAGRPYNLMESHGFVDTDEFESIKLKKEIHLSDVYNVILNAAGVRAVNNLAIKDCDKPGDGSWRFQLPENYIPDFQTACSAINFFRNGIRIKVDTEKYDELFKTDFRHNGKLNTPLPSPYFDVEIPKGVYRKELADYKSIQTEFPKVYGIGEGGLSANAPNDRIAKARQLKGYLLFFDQLLANYVSQLKNIRSLFAMSHSENGDTNHTYFLSELSSVPDLKYLLRFNPGDGGEGMSGNSGEILAVPVSKKYLQAEINKKKIKKKAIEKISNPFSFSNKALRNTCKNIFLENLSSEYLAPQFASTENNAWFFYFALRNEDIKQNKVEDDEVIIISKNFYESENEAKQAADSIICIGSFKENYREFNVSDDGFSFDIELNLSSYSKYLQLIIEDKNLYSQRREKFLDHLLSRFAERFTDFALLSYGFLNKNEIVQNEIQQKESFLTRYDELSSNRGKGYDYRLNGWKNENISGFEKRVAALAGMNRAGKHSLCNFVLEEKDEQFLINIQLKNELLFTGDQKYFLLTAAEQSIADFFQESVKKENYEIKKENENNWMIKINSTGQSLSYKRNFDNQADAELLRTGLYKLFSTEPTEEDVQVSKSDLKFILYDALNKELGSSVNFFKPAQAEKIKADRKKFITKYENWNFASKKFKPFVNVYVVENVLDTETDKHVFFDLDAFKIKTDNDIVLKPDKFEFELLDINNNFKFTSTLQFDSAADAEDSCYKLLSHLIDSNLYFPESNEAGKFVLRIKKDDLVIAENDTEYESESLAMEAAKEIIAIVKEHQFFISVEARPRLWNFSFLLGYEINDQYLFKSSAEFDDPEIAMKAAKKFYLSFDKTQLTKGNKKVILKEDGKEMECIYATSEQTEIDKSLFERLSQLHELKKEAGRALNVKPASYSSFITRDFDDPDLKYVYRLVDKDNLHAVYITEEEIKDEVIKSKKNELFQGADYYVFTEISLGGAIINKIPDAVTKTNWYYYQIKATNKKYDIEGMVLFESIQGYFSEGDARNAFNENIYNILSNAMLEKNYGDNLFISLEEKRSHEQDAVSRSNSLVFVPAQTKEILGTDIDVLKENLTAISKQFPVRVITKDDDEFYKLFPCETDEREKLINDNCINKANPAESFYYFILTDNDGIEKWRSVKYFDALSEAWQNFYYFKMLLKYPGNYYVDQDLCDCKSKIFIREVLAESKERFPIEPEATDLSEACSSNKKAWEAVEEFICVSQTENAFHTYFNSNNCNYTFNIACDQTGLIHLCKYDVIEKRDEAVIKLLEAFNKYTAWKIPEIKPYQDGCALYDLDGNVFAVINSDSNNSCICFAQVIENLPLNLLMETNDDKNEITITVDGGSVTISDARQLENKIWLQKLLELICYYPVRKNGNNFAIELNLPGFNCYENDFASLKLSGSEDENGIDDDFNCSTAWKTGYCFGSCEEALNYYENIKGCVGDSENYLPVFECDCGPYGIKLNCNCIETSPQVSDNQLINPGLLSGKCCNEVIAFNPQYYSTPDMACDAAKRSKKLINAEGLHLVEHILLRPSSPKDCNVVESQNPIGVYEGNKLKCNFPPFKESGEEDKCDKRKMEIDFNPGKDPYSFIVTVALPAWSERFKSQDNRLLVENLLYRETPAHVMLRILWLAPYDLCCFESHFKKWNYSLAYDFDNSKSCYDSYSGQEFIDFLFNKQFECFKDCEECLISEPGVNQPQSCFPVETDPCAQTSMLEKINELFCWEQQICPEPEEKQRGDETQIVEEKAEVKKEVIKKTDVKQLEIKKAEIKKVEVKQPEIKQAENISKAKKLPVKKIKEQVKKQNEKVVEEKRKPDLKEPSIADDRTRNLFFRARQSNYIKAIAELLPGSNGNDSLIQNSQNYPLYALADNLTKNVNPVTDNFLKAMQDIISDKVPVDKKKNFLKGTKKKTLVATIFCSLLDHICADQAIDIDVKRLAEFIIKNKNKISWQEIMKQWNFDDYKKSGITVSNKKIDYLKSKLK